MTRGRQANHAYSIADQPTDSEPHQDAPGAVNGRAVLEAVLTRTGAETSAHQALRDEQDRWGTIAQLAAEYDTIAAAAQRPRWTHLIRTSGLTPDQADQVIASDAFAPLTAALRHAEAHHHTPEQLLPRLIAARPLNGAGDIAAVLHNRRTAAATPRPPRSQRHLPRPARLIVGLIPHANGPVNDDMRTALDQRQHLIEQRAAEILRTALGNDDPWTRPLSPPPTDPLQRRAWLRDLTTIAAYRDRHAITSDTPIPRALRSDDPDAHLAHAAMSRAHRLADATPTDDDRRRTQPNRAHERRGPSM